MIDLSPFLKRILVYKCVGRNLSSHSNERDSFLLTVARNVLSWECPMWASLHCAGSAAVCSCGKWNGMEYNSVIAILFLELR